MPRRRGALGQRGRVDLGRRPGDEHGVLVREVAPGQVRLAEGGEREGHDLADLLGVGGGQHREHGVGREARGRTRRHQVARPRAPADVLEVRVDLRRQRNGPTSPAARPESVTGTNSGTSPSTSTIRSAASHASGEAKS